jgi:DMSO/TMAO reductase YedYZ molybdopterin-dependent catalytic subunit
MFKSMFTRREQEDSVRKEGRLPPGQSLTQKFPVLHYGPAPRFDPTTWDFRIYGEVEKEARWTWDKFNQLPRTKVVMDIHCVTRWSKFDTEWEGVSVQTLIEEGFIKLNPTARYVVEHAEYGYTTNLPVDVILQPNFLLATHFDGLPITPDHGYPLRGVIGAIPDRKDLVEPYLWKGAKWIRGLQFTSHDRPGFWEQAGYHNEADIWKEQRFGRGW